MGFLDDAKDRLGDAAERVKETVGDVGEKVRDTAGDVTEKVRDTAGDVTGKVRDIAGDMSGHVQGAGHAIGERAAEAKDWVATRVPGSDGAGIEGSGADGSGADDSGADDSPAGATDAPREVGGSDAVEQAGEPADEDGPDAEPIWDTGVVPVQEAAPSEPATPSEPSTPNEPATSSEPSAEDDDPGAALHQSVAEAIIDPDEQR